MPYNFQFAMSAELTKDTIVEMIKHAVETQSGQKVKTVTLNVANVGDDRFGGGNDYQVTGARVTFDTTAKVPSGVTYR